MRMRMLLAAGLVWSLVGAVTPARAQQTSLVEVARQEAARRKAVASSKKVYTNKDLGKGRPLTTGASPRTTETPKDAPADPDERSGDATTADAETSDVQGGKHAPAPDDPRLAQLRAVKESVAASAMESLLAIEKGNLTIVNLFDEAQRNVAIAARDARLDDYRRFQAEIEAINKQIAEIEAARKPPAQTPQ